MVSKEFSSLYFTGGPWAESEASNRQCRGLDFPGEWKRNAIPKLLVGSLLTRPKGARFTSACAEIELTRCPEHGT